MDSRFKLLATFTIYGEEFKADWSLNWTSDDPNKIDRRITEWFLDCHDTAEANWYAENAERDSERRVEETRQRELAELKRLKEKYPDERT